MEVSFASENDIQSIRYIWQYCFKDSKSYMDAFFSSVFKAKNTLVVRENATTIAALQMFPHTLMIDGKAYKSMYIGGVSVLPAYRKRGFATLLMERAEAFIKSQGIEISFLVPFSFEFYKKLGYSCISFLSEYEGEISALKPFISVDGDFSSEMTAPILGYSTFSQKFSLYAARDAKRFENEILPLCEGAYLYSLKKDNGYLLYTLFGKKMNVLELAYKDEKALRQILGFIYSHRSDVKTFCIRASAGGDLRKLLCENTITEKRYPHAMAKALTDVPFPDSMDSYINMLGWF